MNEETFDYKSKIKSCFLEKKSRNNGYSIRAFARDLGISSTSLSDLLAGKRDLSKKNALLVSESLHFSPLEIKNMFSSLLKKHDKDDKDYLVLQDQEFSLVSKWYYIALLTMARQKNCTSHSSHLGKRLGVSSNNIKEALGILKKLELIEIRGRKIIRTSKDLRTTTDLPSSAIQKYHKENLALAENAINKIGVDKREMNSMTLNINPKKIPQAKELMRDFRDKFTELMEDNNCDETYTIAMHFFPTKLKG